eukprot:gnl/Chilomastix_cuspidata/4158.p1 GENE.gnl/Chilomastix_cuspidata/4158~~gnl/Chilomastix_cuspidata/4158.p1  ORF type:complete len:748 (+),score=245.67 gnl/Chilomastix_cuspidata/4158:116-2359(+)
MLSTQKRFPFSNTISIELPLFSASVLSDSLRFFAYYHYHDCDPDEDFFYEKTSEHIQELCLAAHYLQCLPMIRYTCELFAKTSPSPEMLKKLPPELFMEILLTMSIPDLILLPDHLVTEQQWFLLLNIRYNCSRSLLDSILTQNSSGRVTPLISPPPLKRHSSQTFIAPVSPAPVVQPRSPMIQFKDPRFSGRDTEYSITPLRRSRLTRTRTSMEITSQDAASPGLRYSKMVREVKSPSDTSSTASTPGYKTPLSRLNPMRKTYSPFVGTVVPPSSPLSSPLPSPNVEWCRKRGVGDAQTSEKLPQFKAGPTRNFWQGIFANMSLQTAFQSVRARAGAVPPRGSSEEMGDVSNAAETITWAQTINMIRVLTRRHEVDSFVIRNPDPHVALSLSAVVTLGFESVCAGISALDLSKIGLNSEHCYFVAEIIRARPRLRRLNLGNNRIRANGARIISQSLADPRCRLEVLHLEHNGLGPSGAEFLARALNTNQKLWRIGLGYNQIRHEGVQALCSSLINHNHTLRGLDIANNYAGDRGARAVAEMLRYNSSLQLLRMWDPTMTLDAGNVVLAALREANETLLELGIGSSTLDTALRSELAKILRTNQERSVPKMDAGKWRGGLFSPPAGRTKDPHQARRRREVDLLYGADTVYSDVWFLVDERWLQQWRDFVSHNSTSDPPGPISNTNLLEADGMTPAKNLRKLFDYRGVAPVVYKLFHRIYRGGPPIVRARIDIYSEPVEFDVDSLLAE